jgi:NitT/TauT family transport system ATP-binding protein
MQDETQLRDSGVGVVDHAPSAVRFDDISLVFGGGKRSEPVKALQDVSFDVADREFCAIVGPSGCGKSTLLNLAAGLTPPTSGRIHVNGEVVRGLVPDMGYVTQDSNLLPWMTVDQNIRLPLQVRKVPTAEQDELVDRWIDIVGLGGFRNSYPRQLSGGMQKRCSIARTLVYDPPILLMDEPFGALDALTRARLQMQLIDLWGDESETETVLMVTHGIDEAILLADRIVVMANAPSPSVLDVIPVPLARPRDRVTVIEDPAFRAVQERLMALLTAEEAAA